LEITIIQTLALVVYLLLLVSVVRHSKLSSLSQTKTQHLLFGTTVSVFVLWIFRAGIYEGLNVHFLWLTALTLILGFRWAMISGCLALIGSTIIGKESLAMFGVNGLLAVSLPVAISYLIYNLSFHRLPRHLFVYIFVCAFFAGALVITSKMALLGGYYWLEGVHDWHTIKDNYLILIPLLLFPEGMLNGMTITLLVIYQPTWVYTFYDKFYLQDK